MTIEEGQTHERTGRHIYAGDDNEQQQRGLSWRLCGGRGMMMKMMKMMMVVKGYDLIVAIDGPMQRVAASHIRSSSRENEEGTVNQPMQMQIVGMRKCRQ